MLAINELEIITDFKYFSEKFAPFIHTINYWSQILGYLIYKCDDHIHRKKIIENLIDENCGSLSHVETFYMFLGEIGYVKNMNEIESNNIVEKYNEKLYAFLRYNKFTDCCEMLGSIEEEYQKISQTIIEYCKKNNCAITYHFTAHEILDTKHANDLFSCSDTKNVHNIVYGRLWIRNLLYELLNL